MVPYINRDGQLPGMSRETKSGWKQGQTPAALYFIHGTAMKPSEVHTSGISPAFSREYLVDDDGAPIHGGRMIFSFQVCAGSDLPANAQKPAVVGKFWGAAVHMYVFLAPRDSIFWCTGGNLTQTKEIAFPYTIESSDIVEYWAPSDNFAGNYFHDHQTRRVQVNQSRTDFLRTQWHSYITSRQEAERAIRNSPMGTLQNPEQPLHRARASEGKMVP